MAAAPGSDRPVLLLDVMDTLVVDPFRAAVPAVFGQSLDAYFARKSKAAYLAFEEGRITEATYAERLFTDGTVADLEALKRYFRAHYRWVEGMEDLLDGLLADGAELHALSNYGVWYQLIEDALDVSRRVPWTFVSCRTGLRKPEPAAFVHAAAHLGRSPAELLFVDDRSRNCEGARTAGLDAVHFVDVPTLRHDLRRRGFDV